WRRKAFGAAAPNVNVVGSSANVGAPLSPRVEPPRLLGPQPAPVRSTAMDFELSPELTALQETCRRVAQDKVKPRAREVDETGEYPHDLVEVFRDAGLLGL